MLYIFSIKLLHSYRPCNLSLGELHFTSAKYILSIFRQMTAKRFSMRPRLVSLSNPVLSISESWERRLVSTFIRPLNAVALLAASSCSRVRDDKGFPDDIIIGCFRASAIDDIQSATDSPTFEADDTPFNTLRCSRKIDRSS